MIKIFSCDCETVEDDIYIKITRSPSAGGLTFRACKSDGTPIVAGVLFTLTKHGIRLNRSISCETDFEVERDGSLKVTLE